MLPSLYIYLDLFYGLTYGLFWKMLHVHLKKKKDMLFTAIGLPDLGNR